ncbi:hypothetical protein [Pseudomonas gorinensis]
MNDYSELKRLAEEQCISSGLGMFEDHQLCENILSLIADNKRLAALLECAQGDCRQAMQIIERLTPEAELYQQIQIAAGSLPSSWEISLRVEKGYGGVDLIDPHGTVVDLDNVDESLSESVASAVAFAMSKEG